MDSKPVRTGSGNRRIRSNRNQRSDPADENFKAAAQNKSLAAEMTASRNAAAERRNTFRQKKKEMHTKNSMKCRKAPTRQNRPAGTSQAVKSQNLEKRAFSLPCISHNLHYTKCVLSKKGDPLPADTPFRRSRFLQFSLQLVLFQNMHKWLRNRSARRAHSLLWFQGVLHRLRWSQSIVPPEPPDNPHLPTM